MNLFQNSSCCNLVSVRSPLFGLVLIAFAHSLGLTIISNFGAGFEKYNGVDVSAPGINKNYNIPDDKGVNVKAGVSILFWSIE